MGVAGVIEISPFEFKNVLINLAKEQEQKSHRAMLDAGRGNPNWIAATPREAFFALGYFAVEESRRVWNQSDLAGKPEQKSIADRFAKFVQANQHLPGITLLKQIVEYGTQALNFVADEWVFELVDGIAGDNYPTPDRILPQVEAVVHEFLVKEMCGGKAMAGRFELFAVEGATAAMCYIFDSLLANHLLKRGDKVAVMEPIFPPYFEIPQLDRYDFQVVEIRASGTNAKGEHTWQYPLEELQKLADPSIKVLFLVNPSNPPSVAMDQESVQELLTIVKKRNPQLMIISDDVYGTFVDNYRSIWADLPYNTIGVYSFSKYFGVTGWRLGVVALAQNNVFDERLQRLSPELVENLNRRYATLSQRPSELRFIDRMVADSRQVALNHTAGLSTPQQVQMALFAAFALLDKDNRYRQLTRDICHRRMNLLYEGLGMSSPNLPNDADYYTEFDLLEWATRQYGKDFADFLQTRYESVDILYRLAKNSAIVLLYGGGFRGPSWSIRVSLANLHDEEYAKVGQELHLALKEYVAEWKNS